MILARPRSRFRNRNGQRSDRRVPSDAGALHQHGAQAALRAAIRVRFQPDGRCHLRRLHLRHLGFPSLRA